MHKIPQRLQHLVDFSVLLLGYKAKKRTIIFINLLEPSFRLSDTISDICTVIMIVCHVDIVNKLPQFLTLLLAIVLEHLLIIVLFARVKGFIAGSTTEEGQLGDRKVRLLVDDLSICSTVLE